MRATAISSSTASRTPTGGARRSGCCSCAGCDPESSPNAVGDRGKDFLGPFTNRRGGPRSTPRQRQDEWVAHEVTRRCQLSATSSVACPVSAAVGFCADEQVQHLADGPLAGTVLVFDHVAGGDEIGDDGVPAGTRPSPVGGLMSGARAGSAPSSSGRLTCLARTARCSTRWSRTSRGQVLGGPMLDSAMANNASSRWKPSCPAISSRSRMSTVRAVGRSIISFVPWLCRRLRPHRPLTLRSRPRSTDA
jgi:hypothetical protein